MGTIAKKRNQELRNIRDYLIRKKPNGSKWAEILFNELNGIEDVTKRKTKGKNHGVKDGAKRLKSTHL